LISASLKTRNLQATPFVAELEEEEVAVKFGATAKFGTLRSPGRVDRWVLLD